MPQEIELLPIKSSSCKKPKKAKLSDPESDDPDVDEKKKEGKNEDEIIEEAKL